MQTRYLLSRTALAALLSCVSVHSLASDRDIPTISAVDEVVQDEIIKQNIPGASLAVVRNGRIVHANGYGHKSLDRDDAVSADTVFRWASISKPLTAVAILQLDEKSSDFSIDDEITDYLSQWPDSGDKGSITFKHLLSNRSGVIHYSTKTNCSGNESPSPDRSAHGEGQFSAEQAVAIFENEDLCFEPGTAYKYSTYGYSLAAAAFEPASGTSYASWVEENVAEPLGMTSLRQATGSSSGFNESEGRLVGKATSSKSSVLPGGGWESNIHDLALFANGLLQNALLRNTSRMWNESTGNSVYRLGIRRKAGGGRVYHGGSHDDLRTMMYLFPDRSDDLGIVLYVNSRHADRDRVVQRVAAELGVSTWSPSDEPVVSECSHRPGSDRYSAVWRRTGEDVLIRKGLSNDHFGAEWSYLRQHGYYTDDFEAYTENGELRWDGVFRKGPGGNAMWRNFSAAGFNRKWREQSRRGYRLVDVETYLVGGERRWAGLFRPGSGRYAMFRYFSTSDFGDKREEMADKGLKLVDIEAFVDGGELRWAGVWVEGEDGLLNRNYDQQDFGELRARRRAAAWKLIDIERYRVNGKLLWAGVWERSERDERLNRNYPFCGELDDDGDWDALGIVNRHNQWREDGFELIDWERN